MNRMQNFRTWLMKGGVKGLIALVGSISIAPYVFYMLYRQFGFGEEVVYLGLAVSTPLLIPLVIKFRERRERWRRQPTA